MDESLVVRSCTLPLPPLPFTVCQANIFRRHVDDYRTFLLSHALHIVATRLPSAFFSTPLHYLKPFEPHSSATMSYSTLTLRTKRGQLRDHKLFSRAGPTKKAIVVGRTKTRGIRILHIRNKVTLLTCQRSPQLPSMVPSMTSLSSLRLLRSQLKKSLRTSKVSS